MNDDEWSIEIADDGLLILTRGDARIGLGAAPIPVDVVTCLVDLNS